jgi:hypothetical protein
MWVLLAVGLPLARLVLRKVAGRAAANNPSSRLALGLNRADSALASAAGRRGRR